MTHQLGLFTAPAPPCLPPIAAKADPATSHLAARELNRSGARRTQIALVVELVRQWPGSTSFELAVKAGVDRHLVGKRLPDAEAVGLVSKVYTDRIGADGKREPFKRPCAVTRMRASVWVPA